MQGLTIVSADDEEVVVVNVMGDIQPEHFGDVMVALDVDDAPEVQIAQLINTIPKNIPIVESTNSSSEVGTPMRP